MTKKPRLWVGGSWVQLQTYDLSIEPGSDHKNSSPEYWVGHRGTQMLLLPKARLVQCRPPQHRKSPRTLWSLTYLPRVFTLPKFPNFNILVIIISENDTNLSRSLPHLPGRRQFYNLVLSHFSWKKLLGRPHFSNPAWKRIKVKFLINFIRFNQTYCHHICQDPTHHRVSRSLTISCLESPWKVWTF